MIKLIDKILIGIIYAILFIPICIIQLIGFWSVANRKGFCERKEI